MRPDILEFKRICERLRGEVRQHNSALTNEECDTVIECADSWKQLFGRPMKKMTISLSARRWVSCRQTSTDYSASIT